MLGSRCSAFSRSLAAVPMSRPSVIMSTWAYEIGSHPQDMTVAVPVFYDDELVRGDDGWRVAHRRFIQVRVAAVGEPA